MRRRFVLRGEALPVEYRDLEIDLSVDAGDGVLYKNKGISRLELVRGAAITRVGAEWRIKFDEPRMMTLVLTMTLAGDAAPRAGVVDVSRPGSEAWRGDVTLEPI